MSDRLVLFLGLALALALTSLSWLHCSSCDPAIRPTDTDRCDEACVHLRELGCPEGDPLEDGTTCEDWCVYTQEQGHALNPTCVEAISSCAEIETCGE